MQVLLWLLSDGPVSMATIVRSPQAFRFGFSRWQTDGDPPESTVITTDTTRDRSRDKGLGDHQKLACGQCVGVFIQLVPDVLTCVCAQWFSHLCACVGCWSKDNCWVTV